MQLRNLRQAKMIKQRKSTGTKIKKNDISKNDYTTQGNKPESTGERRKIKKILRHGKTIQTKQDIPKQQEKILPTSRERWYEDRPTTGCKGSKILLPREHNKNAKWINNLGKKVRRTCRRIEAKIQINLSRTTLKK